MDGENFAKNFFKQAKKKNNKNFQGIHTSQIQILLNPQNKDH
jgi:hypothetical protein